MGSLSFTEIVLGMRSNAGNKNIYAASLLIKIPFALHGMLNFTSYRKLFFLVSFSLGTLVIILLNSRTTYLSYLLVIAFTIIYEVIRALRSKQYTTLYKVLLIIIPGIIAILFSQALINSTKYNIGEDSAAASQYGSATERMTSITSDKDESRKQRLAFWKHAIDYTKAHPLKGAGYGNWKIFSSKGERDNEYYIPYHVHNDFIEIAAELGIIGGLLFIGIFIMIAFGNLKTESEFPSLNTGEPV
jgi:O-antigen ligase